jgi:hypothetical protein
MISVLAQLVKGKARTQAMSTNTIEALAIFMTYTSLWNLALTPFIF